MKTVDIGQGIFFGNKNDLMSRYAISKVNEDPKRLNEFRILEQEATTDVTSAVHGMCRDQILLHNGDDFIEIIKELNPKQINHYTERIEYLTNKHKFRYEFDDYLTIVRRTAIVEFIMTKNALFYDKDKANFLKFCKDREISTVPCKDGKRMFSIVGDKFVEAIIPYELKIKWNDYLFDDDILDSFTKESPLKYVYSGSVIKGVMHYCDYNRKPVYVYLYGLINELEESIRNKLSELGKTEKDLLAYLKEKSEKYEEVKITYSDALKQSRISDKTNKFQNMNLSHLLRFYNHLCKECGFPTIDSTTINDYLRNSVMHSRSFVTAINIKDAPEKYDFESFEKFRNAVKKLLETLRMLKEII
jgi:hypothetical protein